MVRRLRVTAAMTAILMLLVVPAHRAVSAAGPGTITTCGTISAPGAYQLTANVGSAGSTGCLYISASNVTLDLAGFLVNAATTAAQSGQAIYTATGVRFVAVKNGVITNFLHGIYMASCYGCSVDRVRISGTNASYTFGVATGPNGVVTDNVIYTSGSQASGIWVGSNSLVARNVVQLAPATGTQGIVADYGSILNGNIVRNASSNDLIVTCPANITGNTFDKISLSGTSSLCTRYNNTPAP